MLAQGNCVLQIFQGWDPVRVLRHNRHAPMNIKLLLKYVIIIGTTVKLIGRSGDTCQLHEIIRIDLSSRLSLTSFRAEFVQCSFAVGIKAAS